MTALPLVVRRLAASATTLAKISLVACVFAALPVSISRAESLDTFGPAPSFSLTESSEKIFTSESLRGKTWIVHFFFSRCPTVCPTLLRNVASLQKRVTARGAAQDIEILSISVDPENDTPAALAAVKKKYQPDEALTSQWHFLTGEQAEVGKILTEGLKLEQGATPDFHTTRIILVDKTGQIRGYFQGLEPEEIEALDSALKELAKK